MDGADEIDGGLAMIKAAAAPRPAKDRRRGGPFRLHLRRQQEVERLGRFPLPVEVILMARAQVARRLARLAAARCCARVSSPTTAT